jgi:hypothetical protein
MVHSDLCVAAGEWWMRPSISRSNSTARARQVAIASAGGAYDALLQRVTVRHVALTGRGQRSGCHASSSRCAQSCRVQSGHRIRAHGYLDGLGLAERFQVRTRRPRAKNPRTRVVDQWGCPNA